VRSIGEAETILAAWSDEEPGSGVRVVVRAPARRSSPAADLERRLAIARALVRAHRRGSSSERIQRLDAAYVATRLPLGEGESYDD